MADISWGTKRRCTECDAPFYDMRRTPITCPKCGAIHVPVAVLKSDGRMPRKFRTRPVAQARAEHEVSEADAPALPIAADAESGDGSEADESEMTEEDAGPPEENEEEVTLEPGEIDR